MFFNLFGSNRNNEWSWDLVPIQYDLQDIKNYSGRIILPHTVLEDLVTQNIQPPYIFEITNKETGLRTFCGVLEFTAAESIVLVPQWIYQQLCMEHVPEVNLKNVKVSSGSFLRLLPHNTEFLEIESPKQELEKCLIDYQVLSKGDEIVLYFEEQGPMRFTVSEVQPADDAIYIVDTDLEVEFLPPIGYEEKMQQERSVIPFVDTFGNENPKPIKMKKPGLFFNFEHFQEARTQNTS